MAAKYPEKVKEMKELFATEARKYEVLPLDASVATRVAAPRPNITAGRSVFTYTTPMTGIPQGDTPLLLNCSYTITADVEIPEGGAEGMILTSGGRFGGYGFYLLKSKPVFLWNLVGLKRLRWQGPDALEPGKHTLEFEFKYEGLGPETLAFNSHPSMGRDVRHRGGYTGTPVDDQDYQIPFTFTGKLDKLTIKIDRPQSTPADIKLLEEQGQRNNRDSE